MILGIQGKDLVLWKLGGSAYLEEFLKPRSYRSSCPAVMVNEISVGMGLNCTKRCPKLA